MTRGPLEPSAAMLEAIPRIAADHDGPFYLYDFDAIRRRVAELRAALPQRYELCYAVKANPALAVLTLLARLGLGADVASAGEVLAVRRAGFPPQRVFMTGPAKTDRDLSAALDAGVAGINVEGPFELDRLERLAAGRDLRVPVQLRLQPDWSGGEAVRIIGGGAGWSKFGLPIALATELLRSHAADGGTRWPHLDFGGIQVFDASNVLAAERIVTQVERVLDAALRLARETGMPLRVVDFGGGFGVPYAPGEPRLDLAALSEGLAAVAARIADAPELADTRLVFEPGRFIVCEAGVYCCRVVDVKPASDRTVVLTDGGIHQFLRPALIGTPHPVRLLGDDLAGRQVARVAIGGPLCTSHDVLDPAAELPAPRVGDLLVFGQCGAYGFSESMPLFLSHEFAGEYGLSDGQWAALRDAPTIAEQLDRQSAPDHLLPPAS